MKSLKIVILLLSSSVALAGGYSTPAGSTNDNSTNTSTDQGQQQQSQSYSQTSNNVDASTRNWSNNPAVDLGRSVPGAYAPAMSNGLYTCTKSITGGVGFSGLGISLGIPLEDDPCNLRQDSETLAKIGEVSIAKEMMCSNTRVFKSSYRAGRPCFPSEDMLDELSPEEMEIYNDLVAAKTAAIVDKEMKADNFSDIKDRMHQLERDTNSRLDNLHAIGVAK